LRYSDVPFFRPDVMICFPKLVSTGLDLFSKVQGGHNYNCIVFYETGYKLNDMRQAARRAWRIGQPKDCYIYYLYYRETMQHRAMSLMSKKMAAALALEGEFSEEGLAAMAGDGNVQMALAKSLAERIDDADMQRSWSKVQSSTKKKPKKPAGLAAMAADAKPSPLDQFSPEVQLLGATMIERQGKPAPEAAMPDIESLARRFAKADANMWAAARAIGETGDATFLPIDPDGPSDADIQEDKDSLYAEPEPVADEPKPKRERRRNPKGPWASAVGGVIREELDRCDANIRANLKVHRPEPDPAKPEPVASQEVVYTEDLLAKMFANLAAHGLTIEDLAC
jgi:hypothetical protein